MRRITPSLNSFCGVAGVGSRLAQYVAMNFSASASLVTRDHSSRSAGVRKYASGDLAQSLYLVSCASASDVIAMPTRINATFFTAPPRSDSIRKTRAGGGFFQRVSGFGFQVSGEEGLPET